MSKKKMTYLRFMNYAFGEKSAGKIKKYTNAILCTLVIVNVCAIVLESSKALYPWLYPVIHNTNYTITVIFAAEYFLRWRYGGTTPVRYLFSFSSIIDLVSIFPALIAYMAGWNLTHFTVLRLLRLYKFFRITRTMQLFKAVLVRSYKKMMFAFFVIFVICIIASTLMFYAEHAAQPQKFSSIIETMWWVISSLTTAGYVPINPVTVWGKILGSIIVVVGVALFAIPAGIISAGFIEEYKVQRQEFLKRVLDEKRVDDKSIEDEIVNELRHL